MTDTIPKYVSTKIKLFCKCSENVAPFQWPPADMLEKTKLKQTLKKFNGTILKKMQNIWMCSTDVSEFLGACTPIHL